MSAVSRVFRPVITGTLKWNPAVCKLEVGNYLEVKKTIDQEDVQSYANLLGDDNPVHLDPEFAAKTRFGRPIAHGMIASGLFGTMFGATIPGAIYMDQNLRFKAPVYVGDTVVARVTVQSLRESTKTICKCQTVVSRESDGEVVIDGEATVLLPGVKKTPEIRDLE